MQDFDYYAHYEDRSAGPPTIATDSTDRPMTFGELKMMTANGLAEIGCHGYYHQRLSKRFERYLQLEQSLALSVLQERLSIKPRYYSLANGMYTKRVVKTLLKTFDKVFTIEGRPFGPKSKVIHRLTLVNPNIGEPPVQQDRHLVAARQLKRAVRTTKRLLI